MVFRGDKYHYFWFYPDCNNAKDRILFIAVNWIYHTSFVV